MDNKLSKFCRIFQLRKLLPLKGAEYQGLVHRYLAFDDEMTRIGDMWPEAERLIDKYKCVVDYNNSQLMKERYLIQSVPVLQSRTSGIEGETKDAERRLGAFQSQEKTDTATNVEQIF